MKNTELRIGNWVNAFGIEQEILIGVFYSKGADVWFVDHLEIKDIEPIPLTPEWLEKFGFEKNSDESYELITEQGVQFYASKDDDYKYLSVGTLGLEQHLINKELEHVHQLQNLYYALTNTELEIND